MASATTYESEWTQADIEEYNTYLNEREPDGWLVNKLDEFFAELDNELKYGQFEGTEKWLCTRTM